ncbi:MAG TPA: SPOR domain-containing protein [Candidatus Acidoferrum sp.]|nr:SPOR domain-containing protein [Candidatus Acidoferrum sp.]
MASGGKRGGGERVLEGRHVIGLFMLMLLFSGLFFTLGYVMGRDQYDGQVRAATNLRGSPDRDILPKSEVAPKPSSRKTAPVTQPDAAAPSSSDWEFYHAGDSNKSDDRLTPAINPGVVPAVGKSVNSTKHVNAAARTNVATPLSAGWNLQVSATTHEADAMALANTLRRKNFPTFVQPPRGDRFYHVLVGPYADQKAVDNARKGLEMAGFKKAIVKH